MTTTFRTLAFCLATAALPAAHAALAVGASAPDFSADAALSGNPYRFVLADALVDALFEAAATRPPPCNDWRRWLRALGKPLPPDASLLP